MRRIIKNLLSVTIYSVIFASNAYATNGQVGTVRAWYTQDGQSKEVLNLSNGSSIYPDRNTTIQIRIVEGGGSSPWNFQLVSDHGYDEVVGPITLPKNYGDFYISDNIDARYFAYCDGSGGFNFYIYWQSQSHTVSQPSTPSGPSSGNRNTSYSYSTGGSSCNQGHSVQYRFDWDADGGHNYSSWSSSTSASHSWPSDGTYTVKAQARCSSDNSVVSNWSGGKTVTISTPHNITITEGPSVNPATIDSGGTTQCSVLAVCSQGDTISYHWEAAAGSFSNANSRTPTWTAPINTSGSQQAYTLTVTASCPYNSKSSNVTVYVNPQTISATLSGKVFEDNKNSNGVPDPGEGLSGALISADSGTPVTSGPDGSYILSGLTPGIVELEVIIDGTTYASRYYDLEVGENQYDILIPAKTKFDEMISIFSSIILTCKTQLMNLIPFVKSISCWTGIYFDAIEMEARKDNPPANIASTVITTLDTIWCVCNVFKEFNLPLKVISAIYELTACLENVLFDYAGEDCQGWFTCLLEGFQNLRREIVAVFTGSPVDIRIIDSQGHVLELDIEGNVNNELSSPGWIFKGDGHRELAVALDPAGEYTIIITGTTDAGAGDTFDLQILHQQSDGTQAITTYLDVPISSQGTAIATITTNILDPNLEIEVDTDGDGTVDLVRLPEPAPLIAYAGEDISISFGQTVELKGSGFGGVPPYQYLWLLGNVAEPNITISPTETTTYTLTITDSAHNISTDSITISVIPPLCVPQDYPTIQSAIDAAQGGETIVVYPGTYYENINFNGKNITLTSTDPEDSNVVAHTIIDGGQNGPVVIFNNNEDSNCTLTGFTITNGYATDGGGIYGQGSSANITHCRISGNTAVENGGGIHGTCGLVQNCVISGNRARQGAGIYCDGNDIEIINNTIVGNQAERGGGVYTTRYSTNLEVNNNIIAENIGGGVIKERRPSRYSTNLEVNDNIIAGNIGGVIKEWSLPPSPSTPIPLYIFDFDDLTTQGWDGGSIEEFPPVDHSGPALQLSTNSNYEADYFFRFLPEGSYLLSFDRLCDGTLSSYPPYDMYLYTMNHFSWHPLYVLSRELLGDCSQDIPGWCWYRYTVNLDLGYFDTVVFVQDPYVIPDQYTTCWLDNIIFFLDTDNVQPGMIFGYNNSWGNDENDSKAIPSYLPIENGGFEMGDFSSWNVETREGQACIIEALTEGYNCARLEIGYGDWGTAKLSKTVTLRPDADSIVSFDYRGHVESESGGDSIIIWNSTVNYGEGLILDGGIHRYTTTVASGNTSLTILFEAYASYKPVGPGRVWLEIDNFNVQSLITNYNFAPQFTESGHWNNMGTPTDVNDNIWVEGDYHLLPDSQCIDAGDSNSPWENEPWPNGGRINIGAYGNTPEATRSRDGLVPAGFEIVNKTRVGRTAFEYELALLVQNQNTYDVCDVQMQLVDATEAVTSVTDESVTFDIIPPGQTATSQDTFRLVVDRSQLIESGRLTWELIYYAISGQQGGQTMPMSLSLADLEGKISGDITGDGKVDLDDLKILAEQWLQPPGALSADMSPTPADGTVNFLDFALLADHWLEGTTP